MAPGQSGGPLESPIPISRFPDADVAVGVAAPLALESSFEACLTPPRFWFQIDYLAACLSGARIPPLATGSVPGTPRTGAGVLGNPGTVVLIGKDDMNDDWRPGVRARIGGWLDDERRHGIELGVLALDRVSQQASAGSLDGSTIVSRPFFDARSGRANAELVSLPGVLGGFVSVDADAGKFCVYDALCRKSICRECCSYLDLLAGYRYMQFGDALAVREDLLPLPPNVPAGSQILLLDDFGAANQFNGGLVGVAAGYCSGPWCVDLRANVAIPSHFSLRSAR